MDLWFQWLLRMFLWVTDIYMAIKPQSQPLYSPQFGYIALHWKNKMAVLNMILMSDPYQSKDNSASHYVELNP